MAEFRISKFRYVWIGNWNTSRQYFKDDVVYYEGSSYVCLRQHTSTIFVDDLNFFFPGETVLSPAWVKMVEGRKFDGNWSSSTLYESNNIVIAGGNLYISLLSHTSSTNFSDDIFKWDLLAVGYKFRDEWIPSTRYLVGDVIRYNGYTYQCILEHESGTLSEGIIVGNNDLLNDSTAETWSIIVENYCYVGDYQQLTIYRKNDLVKYGGSILKCIEEHESPSENGDILSLNFTTYLPGYRYTDDWSADIYYAIGDVVRSGGNLYTATINNYNSTPGSSQNFQFENPDWIILNRGQRFRGNYDPLISSYKQGDVVRIGGSLWVRTEDQILTDSTLVFLDDTAGWELVITGQNFRGNWSTEQFYDFGDVAYFRGSAYYAQIPHVSVISNFPGNSQFSNIWSILISGDQQGALVSLGDILTYGVKKLNLNNNSILIDTDSSFGTTNLSIGSKDQLLVVNDNFGNLGYKTWGTLERVIFVSLEGIDDDSDLDRGFNYFKPYRTVRFALERADDDFPGTTTIKVAAGEFQEILPLIVPARTAVVGTELRSTTIRANEPILSLSNDVNFTLATLLYLGIIIPEILQGLIIEKTNGNENTQVIGPSVSLSSTSIFNSIWSTIIAMIDFRVNNVGSSPPVTGSNSVTADQDRLDIITILENNREFIKDESIAWMAENYPTYSFDTVKCRRDLDRFITASQYDVRFPGNYKVMLAARYYANAVTGSQLEDMFYVRDTTGLRNMTLKGLDGVLPALQEGQVYRIPTGGAYVSLDPGWGPDDERVWVINRSCYVQNVTTFGVGAIGQKIDGALHAGGNKSIVSNDFTQVISDGIGAWVQNGGRAELVSVFTYYAHIGMFAKDGGIIRATNGNSSYGDFGAIADGIDIDEEVRFAKVNTRTRQAQVAAAFAGEVLDFILALEFDNCGQNYTTANYSIRSSGTGAVALQEEIRDDSMFVCQVLSPGFGFRQFGNQAQLGDEFSITLATAETVTEAEILGMRLIITSGEGTGQYGYIQAYDTLTKICVVYRESDNQPGWDNVLPGIPPRQLLTTGTRYRIEPRVTFNEPPYEAEEYTLSSSSSWSAGVYGETADTFVNIVGTPGTGTTIDVPAAPATFNIIKTGRRYTVTLSSAGAGYFPNDTIILDGGLLGGQALENDIIIRVLSTSDDSTNSISTWEIQNTPIAASGRYVITPLSAQTLISSTDGVFWEEYTLPSSGNWKCLTWGNNRFVAIRNGSNNAAWSNDGKTWNSATMPASRNWNAVAYGKPSNTSNGVFVAIAGNLNAGAFSTNGTSWTSFTMPTFGDSTLNEWVDITFGFNRFVVIANSGNVAAVGTWNGTSISWQPVFVDNTIDPKDWVSIVYGNRRFVAMASTGEVAYSFDGLDWELANMPTADGSTLHNWKRIRYGQGVFFAVGDTGGRVVGSDPTTGPTTFAATSYDGIVWTGRVLASEESWNVIAFGNPDITLGDSTFSNSKPIWIAAPDTASDKVNRIFTGAKALGRAVLSGAGISSIKIWEPGSGYINDPVITLTDPNKTDDISVRTRLADGVLAQPTFITKGTAYKTSTTFVTVSGDGFADITPVGNFITFDDLEILPGPGAQFYISNRTDFFTATVVGIDKLDLPNGKIRSTFRVSPRLSLSDYIEDNMEVLIRERYSQVRITGHDFLDVGTGNFEETNYPRLYTDYDFTTQPFQEVQNLNGGKVFYTSTDQDGNFRAGQQFVVQQATGILTISADFFDLSGLTEIRLAGINVGSTAVIREFSKDPGFLQNSNNVIPTQRAIAAYLQSRLNVGGEDLLTPSFIAGTVRVGPNLINSAAGLTINFPVMVDFSGSNAGISGSILAQTLFYRSFQSR